MLLGADALADGEGDAGVVDAGFDELGIAGSGGTSVCFLAVPLAITRAMTNAATSSTAAAAAIHSQRGALAAQARVLPVADPAEADRAASTDGSFSVGWVAFALGAEPE